MSKKEIIISINLDKDFDEIATTIEQSFDVKGKSYLSDGSIKYVVKPRNYHRRVLYSEEQAKAIILAYKQYLEDHEAGIKYAWYHAREGRKLGLSKKQVITILKNIGILRTELHNTHRMKEE
ncbi:hypothetical protein HO924_11110 [Streptococcus suis]|nr:hypothetical protein [Streptococcus suis]